MSGQASPTYLGSAVTRAISVWGLLVLLVLLVIVFSLLKPDTFLTYFNIRSILSNKSVQALVALSVFIPMTANQFDLSAGFNVGISQVLRHRAAGAGPALVGRGHRRRPDGRVRRPAERPAGDADQDRFLHRHPRHRHRALRPERLVHRRPAGARRPAAGVPGDLRQYRDRARAGDLRARRQPGALAGVRISCRSAAISMCSAPARAPPS